MSSKRAEQFNDFHDAICAEWEHSDRPRSGQWTVEAYSGHSVTIQLSLEIETSFPFFYLRSAPWHQTERSFCW